MGSVPHLNEFVEIFEDEDFVLIMVSPEDTDVLEAFVSETEVDMWVVRDADGSMFEDYGVSGIPDSIIIGKDGKIAYAGDPRRVRERDIQSMIDAD